MEKAKRLLENLPSKIVNNVPSYFHGQQKMCQRKIKETLQKYEVDDSVIESVNEDFCKGFSIAKRIILDIIEEENEKYLNISETEKLDSPMLNQPMTR